MNADDTLTRLLRRDDPPDGAILLVEGAVEVGWQAAHGVVFDPAGRRRFTVDVWDGKGRRIRGVWIRDDGSRFGRLTRLAVTRPGGSRGFMNSIRHCRTYMGCAEP